MAGKSVEHYDPGRHATSVAAFITKAAPDELGFRRNRLSADDWARFLLRADALAGRYFGISYDGGAIDGVVAPTVRSSPVFRDNAFLHVFGRPSARCFVDVSRRLRDDNVAAFCQTLVSDKVRVARDIIREAHGRHIEDEISLRARNDDDATPTVSASTTVIRPAQLSHRAALARLHDEGFRLEISYQRRPFDDVPSDDMLILLAIRSGEPVGYCEVEKGEAWWIESIVVSQAQRGAGIGTSLLASVFEKAPVGASISLKVSSRNTPAIELYRRFRFEEIGRERRYIIQSTHSPS